MVSTALSATVIGLEAEPVFVEVHFSKGQSKFFIVGLPDKACSESKERVSAVVKHYLGHRIPAGTITVNLAPADILKSGPVYDLPIAVGIFQALGMLDADLSDKLIFGELGLDGNTRYTNAILPIADLARWRRIKQIFIPHVNAQEACLIPHVTVYGVKTISQLLDHLSGKNAIAPAVGDNQEGDSSNHQEQEYDFSLIRGQEHAKRALEIAAAGGHNVLMTGTPGSGKTLLARSLPTIQPSLTLDEKLEVTKIYSVAGMLPKDVTIIQKRPFRKPHHTISHVALIGGGAIPRPGEITLAHRGVLFLDEFSEFSKQSLEALRQPLEDGVVTISRAKGSVSFPAQVLLIAAMNPCRCGWLGDDNRECTCSPRDIVRYKKKISGPILDRIDMQIHVKRVPYEKLQSDRPLQTSRSIRKNVQNARDIQIKRFQKSSILSNSEMSQKDIKKFIHLDEESKSILKQAVNVMNLSARSFYRLIRISRTIADLESSGEITSEHISEALSYRMGDDG